MSDEGIVMTDPTDPSADDIHASSDAHLDPSTVNLWVPGEGRADHAKTDATNSHPLPGPSWLSAIGWMLIFLLGQMLISLLIGVVLGVSLGLLGRQPEEVVEQVTRWATATATLGSFLIALVLVWFKYGSETPRILGLRRPDILHMFIVVLFASPLWVVGSGMGDLIDHLLPIQWDIQGEAVKQLATTGLLSIVVAGSVFPAVGEEIFFRGFLGRGLVARYGVVAGVLFTSLAFGLFHLTPSQIAGTFVMGLGFHAVFLTTKALPAAMFLHFLINFQGLTILSRQPAQNDPPLPDVEQFSGFDPYLALLAIPTVGLLGLILYRLRTRWHFTSEKPSPVTYVSGETPPVPAVAIRDSLVQHWRLAAVSAIVWSCFAVGFLRSGVLGL
jgi:uncharacterized protein